MSERELSLAEGHAFVVTLLVLYVLVYIFGRSANRAVASRWVEVNFGLLGKQFHSVGFAADRSSREVSKRELENPLACELARAESARCFKVYATGRRFCTGCLIQLDLKPRQDLLFLAYSLFYVWEDTILVDVPMNNEDMDPMVFSIIRKADVNFVKKSMLDIATLTRQIPLELLPKKFLCLTDSSELVGRFLLPPVVKILREFADYIELLHLSDQNNLSGFGPNCVPAKALRFRFRLPKSWEDSVVLLSLVFQFVDLVGTTKLSPVALRSAQDKRSKMCHTRLIH